MSKKSKSMHKKHAHGIKHIEEEVEEIEKDVHKLEKDVKLFAKFENIVFEIIIILIFGIALGALAGYMVGASQPVIVDSGNDSITVTDVTVPVGLGEKIQSYVNTNMLGDPSLSVVITDGNNAPTTVYTFNYKLQQEGITLEEGTFYSTGNNLMAEREPNLEGTTITPGDPETDPTVTTKSETPAVDLFIMSFCPYGLQAVGIFDESIKLLSEEINFNMGYVIYSDYASGYGLPATEYCLTEEENYCSMHGIEELNEDVRELCIQRDQKDKFWPYMDLLVADYEAGQVSASNIASKWKGYAEAAGVDIAAVEACQASDAATLLEEQVVLNARYGVRGSPTALINGTAYNGARTSEGFKTAICSSFESAPESCGTELSDTSQAAAGSC